jgi:hypothetical protein
MRFGWVWLGEVFMKLSLVILMALSLHAQTLSPVFNETFAYTNSKINLLISFQDTAPSSLVTGLQWAVILPTGFTAGAVSPGAATPAGTTITCNPSLVCIAANTSTTPAPYASGVVAIIPITLSTSALGQPPLTLTGLLATNSTGTNIPITSLGGAALTVAPAGGNTKWFSITSGGVTCTTTKAASVPIHISWSCSDQYGGQSGSFTADGVNAGVGGNIVTFGLNSMGPANDSVYCVMSINTTSAPLTMNGGTVQANSAAYSCSGTVGPLPNGTGSISWP